jgi:predicted alpha/beta superfamily hydrolase
MKAPGFGRVCLLSTFWLSISVSNASPAAGTQEPLIALNITAPGVAIEPSRRMRAANYPWDFEIRVALPPSYRTSHKSYPVLWVTDGGFQFGAALQAAYVSSKDHVPEMIVVGIGPPPEAAADTFKRRDFDFTPVVAEPDGYSWFGADIVKRLLAEGDRDNPARKLPVDQRAGGAPAFLAFLVDTVRPALAREYRMSDEHVLFGHSGGGFFCTYALFARPQAFRKYICGSPSLSAQDFELFRMEARYASTHADLPAAVYFGAGEGEATQHYTAAFGIVSSMTRMVEILSERHYPSLKLYYRIFPGEEHTSMTQNNLNWGLRTLWDKGP